MPTKLKFYKEKDKKIYTLKEKSPDGKSTKDAHYKFKEKFIRENN